MAHFNVVESKCIDCGCSIWKVGHRCDTCQISANSMRLGELEMDREVVIEFLTQDDKEGIAEVKRLDAEIEKIEEEQLHLVEANDE